MAGIKSGPGRGMYPSGLRHMLSSAGDIVGDVGGPAFLGRVLPWSFRRDYFIFTQGLDAIVQYPPPAFPLNIREMRKEDIPAVRALRKGYYTEELLVRRLDENHVGFLGWSESKLIYCHWVFTGPVDVPYLQGRLILGRHEAYSDEVFTRPGYRGAGVYGYCGGVGRRALREKGFRKLFCAVASWNEAPRHVMIKSGMTEIARLRCLNFPGFERSRWSGQVDVKEDKSFTFKSSL
jgi:hypothetical protein